MPLPDLSRPALPDLDRPTIGVLMTPERRWSQLARIDRRLLDLAAAEELSLARVAREPEREPLPEEPPEYVFTEGDVRRIALEVLAELLGVPA